MVNQRRKFITALERKHRIEAVMRRKGWSWYMLSKVMNYDQTTVQRAFKVDRNPTTNPSLPLIKACAIALEVTAGFLIDYREVK